MYSKIKFYLNQTSDGKKSAQCGQQPEVPQQSWQLYNRGATDDWKKRTAQTLNRVTALRRRHDAVQCGQSSDLSIHILSHKAYNKRVNYKQAQPGRQKHRHIRCTRWPAFGPLHPFLGLMRPTSLCTPLYKYAQNYYAQKTRARRNPQRHTST